MADNLKKLIPLYGAGLIDLHFARTASQTSAKTRILRLPRTDENVQFVMTLAAAGDIRNALKNCCDALAYCLGAIPDSDPIKQKVEVTRSAGIEALAASTRAVVSKDEAA